MPTAIPYYLPVFIVVIANTFYHLCTKSIPGHLNPFVGLIVAYLVAAAASLTLFFMTAPSRDLLVQMKGVNWAPFVLGLAIVGLEVGFIPLYRVGWDISIGPLVCNIALTLVLIVIGLLFYKEVISLNQLIGIGFCIAGLIFINR